KRLKDSSVTPLVLAVTGWPDSSVPQLRGIPGTQVVAPRPPKQVRKSYSFTSTLPLAVASDETFEELAIDDPERVYFTVIDSRGVVRFVAPVAPGSDDLEAAVDEVLAAAEQAEHQRMSRR